ncbi:unnamed protein product [Parascedosporium putredinis]|uniref:Uncharacterized protein n=1 Tax=Parascedosporium putredinis TaxID=1442378 RepID=A0A9P1H2R3_9PEZI|nr:unnamed protein product [Parascedosporium putredinis]CAI7993952.1 unnamed protein product [Parascedosporium putredinis]
MAGLASIPIICCGRLEKVGNLVINYLRPRIEVVQFVFPGESGSKIIPALLAGKPAPAHAESSSIGTGNYSRVPRAVLFGAAFDEETIRKLRETQESIPVTDERYISHASQRSLDVLLKLDKEGALDGSNDDLVFY